MMAALIEERGSVHGEWGMQTRVAFNIKSAMNEYRTKRHTAGQMEAMDMIAVKLARICCGDNNHEDHWRDIAGYATLAANALEKK